MVEHSRGGHRENLEKGGVLGGVFVLAHKKIRF